MKDTIEVTVASRATQTLSLSLSVIMTCNDRCVSKHFRIVSKVIYSFQNFLWKHSVIIVFYFSLLILVCTALEAGKVEVTLSHVSALLPYFFPVPCHHLVHFDLPPSFFLE